MIGFMCLSLKILNIRRFGCDVNGVQRFYELLNLYLWFNIINEVYDV